MEAANSQSDTRNGGGTVTHELVNGRWKIRAQMPPWLSCLLQLARLKTKRTYYYVICTVLHVRFCIWMLNICIEGKFLFVLIAIEEIDISWLWNRIYKYLCCITKEQGIYRFSERLLTLALGHCHWGIWMQNQCNAKADLV